MSEGGDDRESGQFFCYSWYLSKFELNKDKYRLWVVWGGGSS